MIGKTGELWEELCEQAAVEQDTDKLLEIITKVNQLLEDKRQRLAAHAASSPASSESEK